MEAKKKKSRQVHEWVEIQAVNEGQHNKWNPQVDGRKCIER